MTIAFGLLLMCAFCALIGIYRGVKNGQETKRRKSPLQ
jgi:hypothetical protein